MARKSKAVVASVVAETEVVEAVAEVSGSELLGLLMTPVAGEVLADKPVVVKNQGVGKYVKELIADGLTNIAILAKVHAEYGNTNTTYACVAWYRNKMKKTAQVASQAKAVEVVEKFMEADETFKQDPESVDLNDEEPDGELETADELRQMVGQ